MIWDIQLFNNFQRYKHGSPNTLRDSGKKWSPYELAKNYEMVSATLHVTYSFHIIQQTVSVGPGILLRAGKWHGVDITCPRHLVEAFGKQNHSIIHKCSLSLKDKKREERDNYIKLLKDKWKVRCSLMVRYAMIVYAWR